MAFVEAFPIGLAVRRDPLEASVNFEHRERQRLQLSD